MKTITIVLSGPDAEQALSELMANIEYEKLEVEVEEVRDDEEA